MSQQITFASAAWATKGKVTRREQFLREMDAVVPWDRLLALLTPHYHARGRPGRPAHPLPVMLRIYFLQQWYAFSDPQAEEALYDSETMRRFVGLELGEDAIPDESTILRFRHLLERHQLTAQLFDAVRALLEERRLLLKAGTIVDATIIAAPSSTKNATGTRDPAMRQTKKGQQWYFGMKAHIGTDTKGIVHTVVGTDAAVADITQLPHLLRGTESVLYGDQAYDSAANAAAWVAGAARERRWAKIWSITDAWVMKATRRIAPWQDGHASGSTSKICCRSAAHRRLASVGARRGAGTMAGATAAAAVAALPRIPRGRLAYQP